MNHFEAVDYIRQIGQKRKLTEYSMEIVSGTVCEGGLNVEAIYADDNGYIRFWWDAAFQNLIEKRITPKGEG